MVEKKTSKKTTEKTIKKPNEEKVIDNDIDDIVFNEDHDVASSKLKKLQKQLKDCQKERVEYLDGWQRARADSVNREKEIISEREKIITRAKEGVLLDIFPILDSFDMAFANKKLWEKVDKDWRMGIEHIYSQILKILETTKIEVIDVEGEKFNPQLHEPIETVDVEDKKDDDIVMSVIQKGYKTETHVLRPAKIVIGKFNTLD